MPHEPPHVIAVVEDLMFRSRIEATAEAAGAPLTVAREVSPQGAETLALVDLGSEGALEAIRALKARSPAPVVVAFGAHRDVERLTAARAAGADQVLARSAFVEKLPALVTGGR